jgi:hypothetical protein
MKIFELVIDSVHADTGENIYTRNTTLVTEDTIPNLITALQDYGSVSGSLPSSYIFTPNFQLVNEVYFRLTFVLKDNILDLENDYFLKVMAEMQKDANTFFPEESFYNENL